MPDFLIRPIVRDRRVTDFTVHALDHTRCDDTERLGCAACGAPDCDHSDPIFAGVAPALNTLFHEKGNASAQQ